MFEIHNYTSFLLAILVFQLIPGAGTIAILNATARDGKRAGMASVIGTLVGDCIFMVAATAGLAAVMRATPFLFTLLQWCGAAYLCWIGIQLIRAKNEGEEGGSKIKQTAWKYFRQACAVSLTNPKVILFFVSFFPLFLRPDSKPSTLGIMMIHVTLMSLLYQTLLVVVGDKVARYLKRLPYARKLATKIAGTALVGFGLKLAADNR